MEKEIARLLISTKMSFEQIASKCECSITEVSNIDTELAYFINSK